MLTENVSLASELAENGFALTGSGRAEGKHPFYRIEVFQDL